jgi:hypothetical protein
MIQVHKGKRIVITFIKGEGEAKGKGLIVQRNSVSPGSFNGWSQGQLGFATLSLD